MSDGAATRRQISLRLVFACATLSAAGLATARIGGAWHFGLVELLGVFLFGAGCGVPIGFAAARWGGAAAGAIGGGLVALLLLLAAESILSGGLF